MFQVPDDEGTLWRRNIPWVMCWLVDILDRYDMDISLINEQIQ